MLVLTRKRLETIKIGNDIVVKVIQTGKGTVKLGIEAPNSVRVLRGELAFDATIQTPADESEEAVMERFLVEFHDLFPEEGYNAVDVELLAEAAH